MQTIDVLLTRLRCCRVWLQHQLQQPLLLLLHGICSYFVYVHILISPSTLFLAERLRESNLHTHTHSHVYIGNEEKNTFSMWLRLNADDDGFGSFIVSPSLCEFEFFLLFTPDLLQQLQSLNLSHQLVDGSLAAIEASFCFGRQHWNAHTHITTLHSLCFSYLLYPFLLFFYFNSVCLPIKSDTFLIN